MRKSIRNVYIKVLSSKFNALILGLVRELEHSNSNVRHLRLTSKVAFFGDTLYDPTYPGLNEAKNDFEELK